MRSLLDIKPAEFLTSLEGNTFAEFWNQCHSEGVLQRPSGLAENDCSDGITDEMTALRFLRARKLSVSAAVAFFRQAQDIRHNSGLNQFYESLDHDLFQETAKLYPQWTGRRDKRGLPISLLDLDNVTGASIAAHKKSSNALPSNKAGHANGNSTSTQANPTSTQALRAYSVHEYLTRFVFPLCSAVTTQIDRKPPVSKQVVLADLTSLSFRRMWELKTYMQDFSSLLASVYPETLDCVLCIGCSSSASTIWNWVKRWIDPVTAAKLQVIPPGKVLETLTSLIEVENIPQKYGGKHAFEPGMAPDVDQQLSDIMEWHDGSARRVPRAPVKWVTSADSSKVAVMVGKSRDSAVDQTFATLKVGRTD